MRTDFMLLSLLDGALSRHMGPTWPARERVPARGNQVFAGTSGWERMDASPVRRSLPKGTGGRIPSSVRLSTIVTTGDVPGSSACPRGGGFDDGPEGPFPMQSKGLRSVAAPRERVVTAASGHAMRSARLVRRG